jgi:hypothetical protein
MSRRSELRALLAGCAALPVVGSLALREVAEIRYRERLCLSSISDSLTKKGQSR